MAPLIYRSTNYRSTIQRSIFTKFFAVVFCIASICALTPAVLAQHAVSHNAGGAVHISTPPVPHVPTYSVPISRASISTHRMPMRSSANGALGTRNFRPRHPIRPFPGLIFYESPFLFGGPFWGLNSCWSANCDLFWPWTLDYTAISSLGPANYVSQGYEAPVNVYGDEGPDLPQLFLKDGTLLNVTDYWLVDDQLHFTMIEEEGGQPVEHVIPFAALDMQKTVNVDTRRGFRFMLRNEPFEQYVRDHPEGPPPEVTLPHE
jgi:hypothetical protein